MELFSICSKVEHEESSERIEKSAPLRPLLEIEGAAFSVPRDDCSCSPVRESYHPTIAPPSTIDKPSSNLTSGLYDQETAEAFAQLEHRRRPSQHLIPCPHSHCLS